MPEVKEIMIEENSPKSALLEIIDNASEAKSILSAMYELYAIVRDKDDALHLETVAVAVGALYEKAENLLETIKQTADELMAAVA